jgi:hypothetical protein
MKTKCDLCDVEFVDTSVLVVVEWGGGTQVYCSRWCAIHALLASLSKEVAEMQTWRPVCCSRLVVRRTKWTER